MYWVYDPAPGLVRSEQVLEESIGKRALATVHHDLAATGADRSDVGDVPTTFNDGPPCAWGLLDFEDRVGVRDRSIPTGVGTTRIG